MKRVALGILGVLLLFVLLLGGLFASAFIGNSAVQPGVVDGFIHVVSDGYVTLDVLDVGNGQVALIDAGVDKDGKALLAELAAMGVDKKAVTAIFLTHGHGDHIAAIPLFPGAKVYALEADIALAAGEIKGRGLIPRWMPIKPTGVKVSQTVKDGDVIQVGNRAIRVFAIPGHTGGSAAYWIDGALFLGDSAGGSKDGTLHAAPKVFSDDPEQNRASLKTLAARLIAEKLDVKTLIFAHTGRLEGIAPLTTFAQGE